ncbi:RluA family pseudouridine synthase [Variovorax terrae]|uniref:RluA family pseudouridine synthase n=1 Tax=Variovorax terrae TaxID=2923278 RepID=A0A9X1VRD3_9BURK|nr:RluA family pseudouridine synthase [Variovorax terrae]MCJ0762401.1 RluA family pseudouridine synthase [Variovorax terrae]
MFQLIHHDDALLVLDKPAGLLAVPGRGPDKQDCLSARVQQHWPDALVVHRLDQATSGLVVMARGAAAQRQLSLAFAGREVRKRYVAVVSGRVAPPAADDGWGVIDLPLIVDWPNRPRSIVDPQHGKPSVTRWRVLGYDAALDATRLALEPVTGRSHQLRVHLQALGHPILGDALYADAAAFSQAPRLLLHACALEIPHPVTGAMRAFASPVPF